MDKPTISISYSHKDEVWKDRLRPHLQARKLDDRREMRLHLADCYLEFARLSLATGDRDSARKDWETAKAMIEDMGYHRRDGEVKEIEAQLGLQPLDGR